MQDEKSPALRNQGSLFARQGFPDDASQVRTSISYLFADSDKFTQMKKEKP